MDCALGLHLVFGSSSELLALEGPDWLDARVRHLNFECDVLRLRANFILHVLHNAHLCKGITVNIYYSNYITTDNLAVQKSINKDKQNKPYLPH